MVRYFRRKIVLGVIVLMGLSYGAYLLLDKIIADSAIRFGLPVKHSVLAENIDLYEYSSAREYLEITEIQRVAPKVAEQLIREKAILFSSLFERQRVGYKGQHTEFVDCPKAYKPEYHQISVAGGKLRYFKGYANDRYVFGGCDRQTAVNYAVNAYLYCSSLARLLDIGYFISVSSGESVQPFIDKLSCENID